MTDQEATERLRALRGATITRLSPGDVQIRIRTGSARARYRFDGPQDALEFATRTLAARDGQDGPLLASLTLRRFFHEEYWPKRATDHLQQRTGINYAQHWLRYLRPALGHKRLDALTPGLLSARFERWREQGVGLETLKKLRTVLSAILSYAMARGALHANPAKAVQLPKSSVAIKSVASPRFAEACRALLRLPEDRLRISLQYGCGLRPEEARGLRVTSIHLGASNPFITLIEAADADGAAKDIKNGRERRVLIPPDIVDELREYLAATTTDRIGVSPRAGWLLFPGASPDVATDDEQERNFVKRYKRAARWAHLQLNDLPLDTRVRQRDVPAPGEFRATFATMRLASGDPREKVMDWMGDTRETVNRHYNRLRDDPDERLRFDEQVAKARRAAFTDPPRRRADAVARRRGHDTM